MRPVVRPVPESCAAYVLDREEYWIEPVSSTFHGRDVFAPAAAHLAAGAAAADLGTTTDALVYLDIPRPMLRGGAFEGRVIYVDRFGNLVANIAGSELPQGRVAVEVGASRIPGLSHSYLDRSGLLALVGSHGYLEIAESLGSAARTVGAGVGTRVADVEVVS